MYTTREMGAYADAVNEERREKFLLTSRVLSSKIGVSERITPIGGEGRKIMWRLIDADELLNKLKEDLETSRTQTDPEKLAELEAKYEFTIKIIENARIVNPFPSAI
jgi:hypothetical protein